MSHDSTSNPHDDELIDLLFRDTLRRDLANATPSRKALQTYRPTDVPERRVRGGGPGGTPCSGFYLLYYVMNSSRSAWSIIPG